MGTAEFTDQVWTLADTFFATLHLKNSGFALAIEFSRRGLRLLVVHTLQHRLSDCKWDAGSVSFGKHETLLSLARLTATFPSHQCQGYDFLLRNASVHQRSRAN